MKNKIVTINQEEGWTPFKDGGALLLCKEDVHL